MDRRVEDSDGNFCGPRRRAGYVTVESRRPERWFFKNRKSENRLPPTHQPSEVIASSAKSAWRLRLRSDGNLGGLA